MQYLESIAGGLLIGCASALLLALNGRIAGISGIIGRFFESGKTEIGWRIAFAAGLVSAGGIAMLILPEQATFRSAASPGLLIVAGILVGVGTSMSNGCTSGHGVCGVARLSRRSIAATITFIGVAALTVFINLHVIGGLA